jgi:hypothetical protein
MAPLWNMAEEETVSWFAGVDWGSERRRLPRLPEGSYKTAAPILNRADEIIE